MASEVVVHKSGWGFFRGENIIHFFHSKDPIILFVFPGLKCGAVSFLPSQGLEHGVLDSIAKLKKEIGDQGSLKDVIIKCIGTNDQVRSIKSALHGSGFNLAGSYTPQSTKTEAYLYCDDGRLRVSEVGSQKPQVETKAVQKSPQKASVARKIRVLVVDDSRTMRQILKTILAADPGLEVVGEAERPSQVMDLIAKLRPDVITLDVNMPEMTGVELLKIILARQFIPTIMITAIGIDEGVEVLKALELGAVDYLQKPAANEMASVAPLIREKIHVAAQVRAQVKSASNTSVVRPSESSMWNFEKSTMVAFGSSTGGTEALKKIFLQLPKHIPPIAVVQHIPPYFSKAFAKLLNDLLPFDVKEAEDGDVLRPDLVLIAPGGLHLEVVKRGPNLVARVFDADPVNRFKPSVDVFFNSVAKTVGKNAVGIILTGMGGDGAKGLLAMKQTGAPTVAQDETSCAVFGMPRAAIELGAADHIESLDKIPNLLHKLVTKRRAA